MYAHFRMPRMPDENLHGILFTLWVEAFLKWVEDHKHLMTKGTMMKEILPETFSNPYNENVGY